MRPIDADKFMTVLNDAQIEFDENYRGLGLAKSMLFEQPTIEATPIIKAHWEQTYSGYVCSNCHSRFTINTMGAGEFCSKCGAKIIGIKNILAYQKWDWETEGLFNNEGDENNNEMDLWLGEDGCL